MDLPDDEATGATGSDDRTGRWSMDEEPRAPTLVPEVLRGVGLGSFRVVFSG